jgi:hypothetical protein
MIPAIHAKYDSASWSEPRSTSAFAVIAASRIQQNR